MLFLVLANLLGNLHTGVESLQKVVVVLVDFQTKVVQSLFQRLTNLNVTQHQRFQQLIQLGGRHLLLGVAPRLGGIAVALDDESVEVQVERLLRNLLQQLGAARNVRRVANHWYSRHSAAELDGQLPLRNVAEARLLERRETTVDNANFLQSCAQNALNGAHPKFDVGVDGILHKYRNINAFQRVGNLLHSKRVGRCAGANPQNVDSCAKSLVNVFHVGNLGGGEHSNLRFHQFQPLKSL